MAYIEIDEERCKGCELCVAACPRQLIHNSKRINHLGYRLVEFDQPQCPDGKAKRCTGCTLCGIICPEAAISVYR